MLLLLLLLLMRQVEPGVSATNTTTSLVLGQPN